MLTVALRPSMWDWNSLRGLLGLVMMFSLGFGWVGGGSGERADLVPDGRAVRGHPQVAGVSGGAPHGARFWRQDAVPAGASSRSFGRPCGTGPSYTRTGPP